MSPFIIVILFLILLVAFQIMIDFRRSRLIKRFKYEQKTTDNGLSIVVELNRSPRNLLPLLDHLQQASGIIELIIIVKRSAGEKAVNRVRAMTESYPELSIRAVTYRRGLDKKQVAKRHAHQNLVMWMKLDERLEGDFIRIANRHFDNPNVHAVTVNEYVPVGATLAQAGNAWQSIRLNIIHLLKNRKQMQSIIYRRRALHREESVHIDASWLLRISHVRSNSSNGLAYALVSGLLFVPLALLTSDVWTLLVWIVIGMFICIQVSWVVAAPAYRISDKILLVLLLPFSLFVKPRSDKNTI